MGIVVDRCHGHGSEVTTSPAPRGHRLSHRARPVALRVRPSSVRVATPVVHDGRTDSLLGSPPTSDEDLMSRSCSRRRIPRGTPRRVPRGFIDPIESRADALAVLSLAAPFGHDTVAILLDAQRRGIGIVVVTGTLGSGCTLPGDRPLHPGSVHGPRRSRPRNLSARRRHAGHRPGTVDRGGDAVRRRRHRVGRVVRHRRAHRLPSRPRRRAPSLGLPLTRSAGVSVLCGTGSGFRDHSARIVRRDHVAVRARSLGGRQAEAGSSQTADELSALDVLGTGGDQLVPVLLGDVVVIPLETSPRDPRAVGELVQFVVRTCR